MMRKLMSACAVLLAMALPLMAQTPACSVLVYPRFVAPNSTTGTPGTGTPVALFAKFVPSAAALPDTFALKFRGGDGLTRGVTWLPAGDFNPANGDTGSWFGDAAAYATGTRQLYFTDANPQLCWIQGKVLNTSTAGPDTFRLRFRVLPAATNYDSPAYEVTALNMTTNGGWVEGNVYSDAGFTSGHQRMVVLAYKADTIAGIYISEGNRIKDTYDSTSAGYFKVAVPAGSIDSIQVRDTLNNIVSSYTRTSPSWVINAGQVTNINGDIIPPTITGTSPAGGATEVALDAQIWVAFSEPVDTLTLAGSITPSPNEDPSWSATMDTLFLSHDSLALNTTYTVKITALTDLAGNPLATLPDSFMFTTIVGDTVKPTITGTYPADGATEVALNTLMYVAFSEAVDTLSLSGTINPVPSPSYPTWNPTMDTMFYVHGDLEQNTTYTLTITALNDLAGNPLSVLPDSFTFTTIVGDTVKPTIAGTSPADGATEVALDAPIFIAFSEPVDTLTLAGSITPSPNEDPSWSATMDTLFLSHDSLALNTTYTVKITALTDLVGNPLATLPDSFMFTTTVGDTVKPYIVSSYPADGDSNVARDATIYLAFSEPIDPASFDGYSSPDLMMSLSWSAGGDTVWLDPDTLMSYDLNFTLICTSATDLAGNPLAVLPDSFSFTTIANPGPAITVVEQPQDTYDGTGPFLVRAVITDPAKAGIAADTLWYTDSHQAAWGAVTHSAIDGDTFSYSIPGPFASGMVIEYFLGAWDDGGSAGYEPGMYRGYQFRILDPLPPESLTAVAGDQQVDLAWVPPAEILDYSVGNGTGLLLNAGDISDTRFTPQHYPCKVEQAVSSWWYAAGSDSVEVHVWADDGSGLPDRSVDLVPPRVVMPLDYPNYTVVDFSSDNLVLSSGDFHVGYVIRSDNHPMPLCDGDGPGLHSTMYDSSAGSWDMVWNSDDYNDWSHQAAVSYSSYSKGLKLKSYVLKSGDKPLTKLAGMKAVPVTSKQAPFYPELQGALFLAKNIYDYTILRATTSGGPYTVVSSSVTPTYVDSAVFNGTQYFYVVRATYTQPDTFSAYSNEVSATPLGLEGKPGLQTYSLFLSPASPNPVKHSAEFRFGLDREGEASLEIFNVIGQKVKTLAAGILPAGNHVVKWNGCDEGGRKVSSGVYVYRLVTNYRALTRRLTVIR